MKPYFSSSSRPCICTKQGSGHSHEQHSPSLRPGWQRDQLLRTCPLRRKRAIRIKRKKYERGPKALTNHLPFPKEAHKALVLSVQPRVPVDLRKIKPEGAATLFLSTIK